MKLKKILAIGILTITSMSIVGACSKKDNVEETKVAIEDSKDTDEAKADEAKKAPEDYGKVTLGKYKDLDIAIEDTTVSEEELQSEIDMILAAYPEYEEIKDRPAQLGDTVNIDYIGRKEGAAFAGGTASAYDLELGSNQFIPGFEDKLVGAKVGEVRNLDLKFPENYHSEELKGQDVVFEVKVNAIKVKKDAELTDDIVKTYTQGEFTNIKDFTEDLRKKLEQIKKDSAKGNAQVAALQEIIDNSKFEVNDEAIEYEMERIKDMYNNMATMYGMSYEDLAQANGMSVEDLDKEIKKSAELYSKQKLALKAIAETEKIELSDDDYKKFAELSSQTREELEAQYGKKELEEVILSNKVADFILDSAKK